MHLTKYIAISLTAVMLTACANDPYGSGGYGRTQSSGVSKQTIGTLGGGAAGAIIGSNVGKGKGNIAAIALGTLGGALLGSEIGSSLDRADIAYHDQAAQQALETAPAGSSFPWNNPQTGHSGSVTPSGYYTNSQGLYCREYNQSINVGGRIENGHGTACRQPDGSWQIVN